MSDGTEKVSLNETIPRLTWRECAGLAFRLIIVGGFLGPATFGLLFTVPIYLVAIFSGENPIMQLLLFPTGIAFAVFFTFLPALVLSIIILSSRLFWGPLSTRLLLITVFPSSVILASTLIGYMDGMNGDYFQFFIASVSAGMIYGLFVTLIVMAFWAKREQLGLGKLGRI